MGASEPVGAHRDSQRQHWGGNRDLARHSKADRPLPTLATVTRFARHRWRLMPGHGSVNHSAEEYVRAVFWHTNTVENYFSIFERGLTGVYHHVSEAHLDRYAAEFDFRYNHRASLDVSDAERANKAVSGIAGKRLTYRPTDAHSIT